MDNHRFILCRNCDVVHHVTASDKAPVHGLVPEPTKEIPTDDWRAFMDQHAGHRMEPLKTLGECYFPAGLPGDPMAVAYLRVTNGKREFLLRRSRRSIFEPLRFERIEAVFSEPVAALEIQERELRKELKSRFRCDDSQSLSDAKVELFIASFRAAASQVQARSVTATEPSYENDNIRYVALQAPVKDFLLKQCARHFSPGEVQGLRRFIETHSAGSDVMTLVLRRQIVVAETL